MSDSYYPWKDLQIEKTDDKRAIKRAYTKILKTIDVDADPEAFIALRAAYDYALGPAQWIYDDYEDEYSDDDSDAEDEDLDDSDTSDGNQAELDWGLISQLFSESDEYDSEGQKHQIESISSSAINESLNALNKLLDPTENEPLDITAIKSYYRTIQNDPALEQLYIADSVENSLADIVVDAGQNAAPLLRLADRDYGWAKRANMINLKWPVSQAAEMAAAQLWLDEQEKGGPYRAEVELLKDASKQPSKFMCLINGISVQNFIEIMDEKYPEAESLLNQEAVDLWRSPPQAPSAIWVSIFHYCLCLPAIAYLLSLQYGQQYRFIDYDRFSLDSLFLIAYMLNLFMFFGWLRNNFINFHIPIEDKIESRSKSLLIEIASYICLMFLPLIAALLPNLLSVTIFLAIVSGAAVIGSGVRYSDNEESFLIRWHLRIGPLLCILLLAGYQLAFFSVQVLIASYALIWVMIYGRKRFDELRFLLSDKVQKYFIWAIIISALILFAANIFVPQYSNSDIFTQIFGFESTYFRPILITSVIALCVATEFFHIREDREIRIYFYFGYLVLLAIIFVFAVPIACLFCIMRMRQSLDQLS